MSLRSFVNLLKVDSIRDLSVFESTTKKFFCASGGSVTWPTPARSKPVTELIAGDQFSSEDTREQLAYSSSPMTARNCLS